VEVGKTLSQDRISRTGPILSAAQACQCDRLWGQARAGNHYATGKGFEKYLASGILVLAVGDRIDESLAQAIDGILTQ
jgi:hypothetical protein